MTIQEIWNIVYVIQETWNRGEHKEMVLDYLELKDFIDKSGLKQKAIAEKSGVPEVQLCLILQGKRKCEVGEYASICNALGVKVDRFIRKRPRMPDKVR